MKWNTGMLLVGLFAFLTVPVGATNQVVVESKTVLSGATGVVIGVRVTNDTSMAAFVVPLTIREVTPGSFISSLAMSWGGRLDSGLTGVVINYQYATENYDCGFGGHGFREIVCSAADSGRAVGASPQGVMFVRMTMQSPVLPPGTDAIPSMKLKVSVTTAPGTFEVDTTCTSLANHLCFGWIDTNSIVSGIRPAFTKGTITIAACNCSHQGDLDGNGVINVTDVIRVIQIAYNNGTDVQDPTCPRTRADVNNTGVVNSSDVLYIQNYVFNNGPAPINPCGP